MAAIPERLWALLSDEEADALREMLAGWRHEPRINCPSCGADIGVRLKITASPRLAADIYNPDPEPAPPSRPASEAAFLEAAKTSGLMKAFEEAVRAERDHSGVPSDLDAFFLLVWGGLQPTKVSSVVLAAWIQEFGGYIEAFQANGILAVLSDGRLVAFVPLRLTRPQSIDRSGPRATVSTAAGFDHWRKGRFGYVPVGAQSFGAAMKQRSIGAFGKLTQ